MVKKKIDNRIRVMIENGVKMKHRTMFVIVGDKGRDQVNNIHPCLSSQFITQEIHSGSDPLRYADEIFSQGSTNSLVVLQEQGRSYL